MKYFIPVFLILSCGISRGQTLTWSRTIGDTGMQSLKEIRIDSDGNTVLFGTFDSYPMESGPGRKPFGTIDVFLHKMDPSGKTFWFRNLGSNQVGDIAMAHEMDMDTAGNIFVLCALHSSGPPKAMAALSGDRDTLNLDAEHGGNYVICKYDPDGTLLWARQFEKQDFPVSPIRLTAGHGKVAVYGSFQYRAKILGGTDSLITANDTGFLAEFTGDGKPLSLMIVDSAAQVELLREDDQGNRYMSFSTRYSSRILEKRRPSGKVVWRRKLEKNNIFNQSNLRFVDLVWDSDGNIYLRGDLLGRDVILRLDDGKDTVLAIQDAPSFCVIKLDSTGTMKWVRTGNTGTVGTSKLIIAPRKVLRTLWPSGNTPVHFRPGYGASLQPWVPLARNREKTFLAEAVQTGRQAAQAPIVASRAG
jgi:outer membrane protein assembly factor BamB